MKIRFVFVQSSKEEWFLKALDVYEKKISAFGSFEVKVLKAKGLGRENAAEKKIKESQLLLEQVSEKDLVILFDEKGKVFSDSHAFAEGLKKALESGKQSVTFLIGGAYGASEDLKQRADRTWSLSALTMNHMLASIVALEQIYRSFTIDRNIPYHN